MSFNNDKGISSYKVSMLIAISGQAFTSIGENEIISSVMER